MPRKITFICQNCGREVETLSNKTTSKKYCSQKCYAEARQRGKDKKVKGYKRKISALERQISMMAENHRSLQDLVSALDSSIHALPDLNIEPLARPEYSTENLDPEDVILHISDVHVGSWVNADKMGDMAGYTYEAFAERADRFVNSVRNILMYHPNEITRAHVVFGGDIVDGATIYNGQLARVDLSVVQQVVFAYERFAHIIAEMAATFPEVVVSGVPGNHGRIGKKGELHPNDNLDWLLYYFLRERFRNVENVRFNVPDTWWMILDVRGWKFLVVHGEDIKSYLQTPFYGVLRYKSKMRELFYEMFDSEGVNRPEFDAVLLAHHHTLAAFNGVYMNGSWVGGSEFSLKRLQAGGLPGQQMMGVHDRHCVAWRRIVQLYDPSTTPEIKIYS